MHARFALAAAVLAALSLPALAQAPQGQPVNVRGTIAALAGHTLTVKETDGATVSVALAPNYAVRTLVRRKLSDIHPGDFVGTTSVPGTDGKLHAIEIHFFPANAPIPERQFPWDLRAGSLMTNAHVTGVAKAARGSVLSVSYKNGTAQVIVDPSTKIVGPAPAPGSVSDLKPGKAVFILARKSADGTLGARAVTVEKNGVKPPM